MIASTLKSIRTWISLFSCEIVQISRHLRIAFHYSYRERHRYCTFFIFQVKFSVLLSYLRSIGVCAVIFTVIFLLLTEISHVTAGFWLASWSAANITSNKQRDFYIGVYGGIGLGHGLFNFLLVVTLCFGSMAASRRYLALFAFFLSFLLYYH